jgi:hypothetical protein
MMFPASCSVMRRLAIALHCFSLLWLHSPAYALEPIPGYPGIPVLMVTCLVSRQPVSEPMITGERAR